MLDRLFLILCSTTYILIQLGLNPNYDTSTLINSTKLPLNSLS